MEFRKNMMMTLKDYTEFNLFHTRKMRTAMFFFTILIIPAITLILGKNENVVLSLVVSTIIGAVVAALFLVLNFILIKHAAKKQYNSSKAMSSENEIVINERGVYESGSFGNTQISWEDVYKAAETKDAYYIYFSRLQAFVVQKRIISIEENELIRSLIAKNLDMEKLKLKQ